MSHKVPVLLLFFNRPQETEEVFERIREYAPEKLFLASDGPRKERPGEKELIERLRSDLIAKIDWNCEVKTLFREENLGCGKAVSGSISWFFDQVEYGMVIEDDCLPSKSFFTFCENLLEKYKYDLRVWSIGAYCPVGIEGDQYSYNFTRFSHVWGWATWANRWKHYDFNMSQLESGKKILFDYEFFQSKTMNKIRWKILGKIRNKQIDTWDYQWNFTIRTNNGMCIRPKKNLVKNLGLTGNGTHTLNESLEVLNQTSHELSFPLKHPPFMMVFRKADSIFERNSLRKIITDRVRKVKGMIVGRA